MPATEPGAKLPPAALMIARVASSRPTPCSSSRGLTVENFEPSNVQSEGDQEYVNAAVPGLLKLHELPLQAK